MEKFLWFWPVGRYATEARTWLMGNQDRKDAVSEQSSIELSAHIASGIDTLTALVTKVDPVGIDMNASFIKPFDMTSMHDTWTNLAQVQREFQAYAVPDAKREPIASIVPGQSVRVTAPPTPDAADPGSNFTEVEINPNSAYAKKVFIKNAFAESVFFDYSLWVTVELQPMTDDDISRDDVRVEAISHQNIGKGDVVMLDISDGVSLAMIRPYIDTIYKSAVSAADVDLGTAFAKVTLRHSPDKARDENTRNALLYLRNLQVNNLLQKIGLSRENISVIEITPEAGKKDGQQYFPDKIQIYLPSAQ